MKPKPMLSGSQLRQYLHISTRKLKYLMDHNYIPHEDTGQATYRYRVRWEDAVAFKQRMDTDPSFLSELVGMFKKWLTQRWTDEPDALPTQRVADLLGCYPQKIHRWVKLGQLPAEQVGRFQYCSKAELISFLATPERMMGCGEVVGEFLKTELLPK